MTAETVKAGIALALAQAKAIPIAPGTGSARSIIELVSTLGRLETEAAQLGEPAVSDTIGVD